MASINNLLNNFASSLYINSSSDEGTKIQKSVTHLASNLHGYFGSSVGEVKKFGSYTRGTILPRTYDQYSDVDIMVVLNRQELNITPRSVRSSLVNFANERYPRSLTYRDSPVVVLELGHIQYDLVPTIVVPRIWYNTTYIPANDQSWQETDPDGFNQTLTDANKRYEYLVKPIVRLMKSWNAKVGYPIQSYALEQEIATMNFSGENYQSGFFYAINRLNSYGYSQNARNKIDGLKKNAERVREALEKDHPLTARGWLSHILPIEKD